MFKLIKLNKFSIFGRKNNQIKSLKIMLRRLVAILGARGGGGFLHGSGAKRGDAQGGAGGVPYKETNTLTSSTTAF